MSITMKQPHHDADVLCDLFITMKIQDSWKTDTPPAFLAAMECDNSPAHDEVAYTGCAYLQAIQAQLESYPTTNGEYLEAIFTHREILSAFPPGHKDCARGLDALASALEARAWRADRDGDPEAVAAFRHEARTIAVVLAPFSGMTF